MLPNLTVERLMESLRIAANRKVAGLGSVQRQALIEHFER